MIVVLIVLILAGTVLFLMAKKKGDAEDDTYLKDEEYGQITTKQGENKTFEDIVNVSGDDGFLKRFLLS